MGLFRRKRTRGFLIDFHEVGSDNEYSFDIVGERHRRDELQAIASAGRRVARREDGWDFIGVQFWLARDPQNSYDPNAVAVWAGTGGSYDQRRSLQVGFIPADLASVMTLRMEQPVSIQGMLVGKGGVYGVKLDRQQMDEAGLSPWRTWLDNTVELVTPSHQRAVYYRGQLQHIHDHPDGPNTIGVFLADGRMAGTIRGTEKLWGPNVHETPVSVRIRPGSNTKVEGYLPPNAYEPTGWECGPHCSTVSESDGYFQATGRLLHMRFSIPICDQARAGFRHAKQLNSASQK